MSQWQSIGYTSVLFVVAIQRIPRELYEAVRVDGAGPVRTFFTITVTLVRDGAGARRPRGIATAARYTWAASADGHASVYRSVG